jgi:hypothetical protein
VALMTIQTPLADLLQSRMHELGLDRQALGFRLGYQNPRKAAGRVHALCDGQITSAKSRGGLSRLAGALEVPAEVVERALAATEQIFAERERQAEEDRLLAREREEAEWRAAFKPHAIIQTERTIPTQITICGFTGGAERWRMIRFDLSRPDPREGWAKIRSVLRRGARVHCQLRTGSGGAISMGSRLRSSRRLTGSARFASRSAANRRRRT